MIVVAVVATMLGVRAELKRRSQLERVHRTTRFRRLAEFHAMQEWIAAGNVNYYHGK
jgi:hypothetical protein